MAPRPMKRTVFTALVLALAMLATACGSGDDVTGPTADEGSCDVADLNLVTPGKLTVATGEPAYPPWVGTTDGEGFDDPASKLGYEAALVYELAAQMGFTDADVVWTRVGFDEAIAPGTKPWDFNLQQYSITEAREQVVDFSAPYYTTRQALVVFEDSPFAAPSSMADLKDAALGAQVGTTSLDFIEDVIKPSKEAAVYNDNAAAKAAMTAGQIDGIIVDLPTAYYITAVEIEGSVIAAQFETEAADPDNYGLLFAEGNSLVPCVNTALAALRDSGKLDELEQTYLTQGGSIPTISG